MVSGLDFGETFQIYYESWSACNFAFPLSSGEMLDWQVAAILADRSKRVIGDLSWSEPTLGATWVRFRAPVESFEGWPLKVYGSYNREAPCISFCLIHPGVKGRLYGLEIGGAHRFPDGRLLEETHKHRWNQRLGEGNVYVPDDITAEAAEPVKAWREFCEEAGITHDGELESPPSLQTSLW